MSWTPSSNAIGYVIDYTSSCGDNNQLLIIDGGSTDEYRVTDLEDGGMYTISIVAMSAGFPSESVIENITLMSANSGTNIKMFKKRHYQNVLSFRQFACHNEDCHFHSPLMDQSRGCRTLSCGVGDS